MNLDIVDKVEALAASNDFSGVVSLRRDAELDLDLAFGFADRARQILNGVETRFGVASATKGLTALTVMSLVEAGELTLDATVRSIVGDQLPNVDAEVMIEHLLCHRSGVGDFIDESLDGDIDDYILGVSAHTLERPSDYVDLLTPHAQVSKPGEQFAYNNSGYVILSMLIERTTGSFIEAVTERVLESAGMKRSGFFRSDALPDDCALGYCEDGRTNVFHLPVVGSGDGGAYLCAADVSKLWEALCNGQIVSAKSLEEMMRVRSIGHPNGAYGMGFWLTDDGEIAWLEGMDAGVSFKSAIHIESGRHYVVLSNTSGGVWDMSRLLDPMLSAS